MFLEIEIATWLKKELSQYLNFQLLMTSQVVTSRDFKKAQIRPPKPHFRAKHKIETHFYFQFGKRMSLRQVDFRKIEKMTCPNVSLKYEDKGCNFVLYHTPTISLVSFSL